MTHPCRYEPDLNPTYQDAMAHYGTAVIPARVKKARDKAKVEASVLIAEPLDHRGLDETTPSSASASSTGR